MAWPDPTFHYKFLKVVLARESVWFIRCGLWRKQAWSRTTQKWVSLPCAQEHRSVQTNRTLATETSYSCLDARFQAHSGATQWLETAAKRKTPLCCSSSGFLWYAAGLLPQKCSPTDWCLSLRYCSVQDFESNTCIFNTNLQGFLFSQKDWRPITFSRQQIVNQTLPNLMMKHTQSPVANREGWFYSFTVCF